VICAANNSYRLSGVHLLSIYAKGQQADDYIFPIISAEGSDIAQIKEYRDSINHALG
jgi:hypothetical protein